MQKKNGLHLGGPECYTMAKSICLDLYVVDVAGAVYEIEMQGVDTTADFAFLKYQCFYMER